ncbi:MAG: 3-hydroxyacyl-CoA dehydrogenase family protein, partial [Proteobacteria bacterium]|nr:3-hydroxyacyl-CoA dehydrogenase family protein [Pseudomonadota bacterium]
LQSAARPRAAPPPRQPLTPCAHCGAGMMGAGIAYATATAGIAVVLIDATQEGADKGKAYVHKLLSKQVEKGRMAQAAADAVLERILPTTDYAQLKGCELVIEAVFEDRAIKAEVTRKTEAVISAEAIFASNTSTLPITGLGEASNRPANFIGLHFFSPAERMPLVEIIVGRQTSPETLARSMDFVRVIAKTPIVVNDSRGFYTSRVFGTYISEGMALLREGVAPALIDKAGLIAGMPVGPLALTDEVSLELVYKVAKQTRADLGDAYPEPPSAPVVKLMIEQFGRMGRKVGKGFYDYPAEGGKRLWPGLAEHFPPRAEQPGVEEIVERLILIQSVESARCLAEKVLNRPQDADVGAILGWGYPPFRGGPIACIHTLGIVPFVTACERLAARCGPRFSPPAFLKEMAAKGESFYKY